MLGMGAYLVIRQELSAGAMFAASLMMGRALAPIDVVIANWRSLTSARQSLARLAATLRQLPARGARTNLPKPGRSLDVEHVAVRARVVPDAAWPFPRESGVGAGNTDVWSRGCERPNERRFRWRVRAQQRSAGA